MVAKLEGGCIVTTLREGEPRREGALTIWNHFKGDAISLRVIEIDGGPIARADLQRLVHFSSAQANALRRKQRRERLAIVGSVLSGRKSGGALHLACHERRLARLRGALGVHRRHPAVAIGNLAVDVSEEFFLNTFSNRAAFSASDGGTIDAADGSDFSGRAGEEDFVGDVERFARNECLDH